MRIFVTTLLFLLPTMTGIAQNTTPPDTTCFSQQQVDNLYNGLRELEVSDSLKTRQIELQKEQIANLQKKLQQYAELDSLNEEKVNTLNDRLTLQDEKIGLLEEKIRRNRLRHILSGAAGGLLIGVLVE